MTHPIEQGATEIRGDTHVLHFLLRLPHPVEKVWPTIATSEGLRGWLTEVEVLEPRLGGAVTLRGLGEGRVTAWDVERVAEYTVEGWGRIRFHLEPGRPTGTTLRFTHETTGERDWHERLEHLVAALGADAP